jgi:hypothetical protein
MNIINIYGIFIKAFLSTFFLLSNKLGMLHYRIFNGFYRSCGQILSPNNFYTYTNLISPILTIFLPTFDVFMHTLDTNTGQNITNTTICVCL